MNAADIDAACRLIAQFEDKALGRHNSSRFRENPVAPQPVPIPEQRQSVTLKTGPEDCQVGDYCWTLRRIIPEGIMVVRIAQWISPEDMSWFDESRALDICTWEFERVWLVVRDPVPQRREAWHRIA